MWVIVEKHKLLQNNRSTELDHIRMALPGVIAVILYFNQQTDKNDFNSDITSVQTAFSLLYLPPLQPVFYVGLVLVCPALLNLYLVQLLSSSFDRLAVKIYASGSFIRKSEL
jgi:hypothetical protein